MDNLSSLSLTASIRTSTLPLSLFSAIFYLHKGEQIQPPSPRCRFAPGSCQVPTEAASEQLRQPGWPQKASQRVSGRIFQCAVTKKDKPFYEFDPSKEASSIKRSICVSKKAPPRCRNRSAFRHPVETPEQCQNPQSLRSNTCSSGSRPTRWTLQVSLPASRAGATTYFVIPGLSLPVGLL